MPLSYTSIIATLAAALFAAGMSAQSSEAHRDRHVEGRVIGESTHIQPGKPYRIGLLLDHDAGWHTYWKSTATGYATSVDWDLPEGFTAGELSWPVPKAYDFQGWTEFVYEDRVLLMTTLTPPETLPEGRVEIGFTAEWLMCADVCIPGEISGMITLPVKDSPPDPSPEWSGLFRKTDRDLPASPEGYDLQASKVAGGIELRVSGELPESAYFFDSRAVIKAQPEQDVRRLDNGTLAIFLPLDDAVDSVPGRLAGVLKAPEGWPQASGRAGLAVDIPVREPTGMGAESPGGLSAGILLLAFAGGLILNLMPCVFPVLGIKIMGFVGQAGASRGKVVSHGLVFTAGVLISFWILAGALLLLRSGGSQLGWGFQLQSPGFVLVLAILLFAFGLNMAGLFEFGQSAVGVGSELTGKSGFAGSFFSGVLATVVATPCAAPFLAPALGAALTLPPAGSILVFTVIALGLSVPYLLLSAFPALVQRLPRPGPWMESFKQFMSFLLFATVAYLLWVLAGQLTETTGHSPFSFLKVLLSLVAVAFALWVFGRWGTYHRKRPVRLVATGLSILFLGSGILAGLSATQPMAAGQSTVTWEKWEPGKAEALATAGKVVYVDFTARWCVTCQTNKAAVFASSKVRDFIRQNDVALLKADWTNHDPTIGRALAAFNRSAVPFNLVYLPNSPAPVILPELLTPGIVLDALNASPAAP